MATNNSTYTNGLARHNFATDNMRRAISQNKDIQQDTSSEGNLVILLKYLMIITLTFFALYGISNADTSRDMLQQEITYNVLQQDVKSALKDISTQMSIPINLAVNVKGKVAAGEYNGTGNAILNQICSDLNLQWFFDGNSIYVTKVSDSQMKILRVNGFSVTSLQAALENIDLDTRKFPLKRDDYNNMITVYGPPRYVAMVEVVAHYLTMRSMDKPSVIRGSVG